MRIVSEVRAKTVTEGKIEVGRMLSVNRLFRDRDDVKDGLKRGDVLFLFVRIDYRKKKVKSRIEGDE